MCVEFQYNMFGTNIGSLSLKLKKNGRLDSNSIFSKSGAQGSAWKQAKVNVNIPSSNTQLVFETVSGPRHLSDIAVDEVKVRPHTRTDINTQTAVRNLMSMFNLTGSARSLWSTK